MGKLPEKWAVERTPDNYKQVNEWANSLLRSSEIGFTDRNGFIVYCNKYEEPFWEPDHNINYPLLTSDQFMQLAYNPWKQAQNSDGWVKCSERLPDYGERVLCMHQSFGVQIGWIMNPKIWAFSNGLHQLFDSVTHWRELPAPPKD